MAAAATHEATDLSADDFTLRAVGVQDREVCAEIAAVTYGGRDYLKAALETWLLNPKKFTALCLAHPVTDRLAAIETLARIDGGETGWMEGLRTHPDWRGRGLARRVHLRVAELAAEESAEAGSPLRRLRYTTNISNKASLKLAEAAGLSIVCRWGFGFVSLSPEYVAKVEAAAEAAGGGDEPVAVVSTAAAVALCESDAGAVLGVAEYVQADWKAYQVAGRAAAAMDELVERCGVVFAAGGGGGFSLGGVRSDATAASWCATLYAGGDEAVTIRHLAWHVAEARRRGLDALMLFYDESMIPRMGAEGNGLCVTELAEPCAIMVERTLRCEA